LESHSGVAYKRKETPLGKAFSSRRIEDSTVVHLTRTALS